MNDEVTSTVELILCCLTGSNLDGMVVEIFRSSGQFLGGEEAPQPKALQSRTLQHQLCSLTRGKAVGFDSTSISHYMGQDSMHLQLVGTISIFVLLA